MKRIKILVVYAVAAKGNTLSYQTGWPEKMCSSPLFEAYPVNLYSINKENTLDLIFLLGRKKFDAIVLLHSVFSNACYMRVAHTILLRLARVPAAFFVGNEYKLMPEKMNMCDELNVKLLVTMNIDERAHELYRQRLGAKVICLPSGAINPDLFSPKVPLKHRPIDLGYRAFDDPLYFLHNDSKLIADYFNKIAGRYHLVTDISMDPKARFDSRGWANFLNSCRGQLGVERGPDVFQLNDRLRNLVNSYEKINPKVTHAELLALFKEEKNDAVSARMITGRHTETAACKGVQILFKGRYNDFFQPDIHYIMLEKDFSNIDIVMEKFRDDSFCQKLVDDAYDLVMEELTYEKLIGKFAAALKMIL